MHVPNMHIPYVHTPKVVHELLLKKHIETRAGMPWAINIYTYVDACRMVQYVYMCACRNALNSSLLAIFRARSREMHVSVPVPCNRG